jgi:hypothetical protein
LPSSRSLSGRRRTRWPGWRPSGTVDFESELRGVLGNRDIQIVLDEATADVVLALSGLCVSLGDIEISLTEGRLSGRASTECIPTDIRTGEVHTMNLT